MMSRKKWLKNMIKIKLFKELQKSSSEREIPFTFPQMDGGNQMYNASNGNKSRILEARLGNKQTL